MQAFDVLGFRKRQRRAELAQLDRDLRRRLVGYSTGVR